MGELDCALGARYCGDLVDCSGVEIERSVTRFAGCTGRVMRAESRALKASAPTPAHRHVGPALVVEILDVLRRALECVAL